MLAPSILAARTMRWILLPLLTLTGCPERVEPPTDVPAVYPGEAWSEVLDRAVRPDGVDWQVFHENQGTLRQLLAWIAENGPETRRISESRESDRLATLLNAHNAVVVDAVLRFVLPDAGPAALLHAPDAHTRRDKLWRVDSEWITLDRLAYHRLLAIFQDPMVHAGLYRANRTGPPLRWFRSGDVSGALGVAMGEWLNSDRGLRAVGDGYAVNGYILDHEADFLEWGASPTLCAWMMEQTIGARRAWLTTHIGDCPLGRFEVDDRLDVSGL